MYDYVYVCGIKEGISYLAAKGEILMILRRQNRAIDDLNDYLNSSIKKFKDLLDEQFKNAKDYKPKIEWFEGTWSRYKPEKGKDKRGVTGYDTKKLKEISNKLNSIPQEVNIHKSIKDELRSWVELYINHNISIVKLYFHVIYCGIKY